MEHAQRTLPSTVRIVFVHLGANDLASPRSDPKIAVEQLYSRLEHLKSRCPPLVIVIICLLTPRIEDGQGNYKRIFINQYNERIAQFNRRICLDCELGAKAGMQIMKFHAHLHDLSVVLRKTGFGPNKAGRTLIEKIIQDKIREIIRRYNLSQFYFNEMIAPPINWI